MKYYLNKNTLGNPNFDHEVHMENCARLPLLENTIYLGNFECCADALKEAKKYYTNVDGCALCCALCHHQ